MPISTIAASPGEVDHIIEAFKSWDEAGSGLISREDLAIIIKALSPGIREEDLDKLFTAAAGDGVLGNLLRYEDFVTWLWRPIQAVPTPAAIAPKVDAADEERRRRGLWQGTMSEAIEKAVQRFPREKVNQYFNDVRKRLSGDEYANHVKHVIFPQLDDDKDGKISFTQVASIIGKSLQCANDMAAGGKITMEDIRFAFDAHDTLQFGRGMMGEDEFLNLMRFLQVRVAEAAMPMSKVIKGA